MKSSVSPRWLAAGLAAAFCGSAVSQDTLVLTNGQRRVVSVLAVQDGRVMFKAGPAESSVPVDQVESVVMEPPKAFGEALEARRAGEIPKALSLMEPLTEKFRGLPAPWAAQAAATLGDLYLENGDTAKAEAAFAAFQSAYPDATGLASLGLARMDVEKGDLDAAETKVAPFVEEARKTLFAESGKSAQFGQALYLMGRILEKRDKLPEALESYLLVTTVFYGDPTVADKARQSASSLMEEKKVEVP